MMTRAALMVAAALLVMPSEAVADRWLAVETAASSTAKGKRDEYAAWRAVDGATGTAWCEGKADEGLDEKLTLTLPEPILVTRIDLYVGLHGTAREYKANNRPSTLFVQTAQKKGDPMVMLAKAVPTVGDYQTLVKLGLNTPRTVQVIELAFAGVTRGDKARNNHTCISDVSLVGDKGEVINFLFGMPVDSMASLPAAITALRAAVASCDEKALPAVVKFPLVHRVAAEEDSRTIKLKNVKALVKACKAGTFPKIPTEADQPGITANGFGGISLETGASEVMRMDMTWNKGSWQLAAIDAY